MTVTQIAKMAGVSIGTVDRVLHNRGRVSDETRQKIQAIIDESSYQPNILAQQLKKREQYKIGLLIPEISTGYGYWKKLYESIEHTITIELAPFSFSLEPFFFTRTVHTSLMAQFNQMLQASCNACIIAPVQQEETLALLESFPETTPYCFVDSPLPEAHPLFTVAQDPYRAGFLAGRLTELTAEKKDGAYLVVRPHVEAFNQAERARGFCDWFKQQGKNAIEIIPEQANASGIVSAVEKALATCPAVAGICTVSVEVQFVADYLMTQGKKQGIAVTGFDNVEKNQLLLQSGAIDCIISQQAHEQGKLAVQKLTRKLMYDENPEKTIQIPLEIFFKENLRP